jgi:hypothetical protein
MKKTIKCVALISLRKRTYFKKIINFPVAMSFFKIQKNFLQLKNKMLQKFLQYSGVEIPFLLYLTFFLFISFNHYYFTIGSLLSIDETKKIQRHLFFRIGY